jgi:hypothetical protein
MKALIWLQAAIDQFLQKRRAKNAQISHHALLNLD